MRPVIALLGTIILVVLLVLAYFVAPTTSSSNSVSSLSSVQVSLPSGGTLLSTLSVTLTYVDLPKGDQLTIIPCPNEGESASACLSSDPGWTVVGGGTSGTLQFEINVGHTFIVTTNAPPGAGTSFTTSVPFWSADTTYLLAGTIIGLVLAGIGMIRTPEEKYGYGRPVQTRPAPAAAAPLRPFCENCGLRFTSPSQQVCPSCGTPRGN